MHSKAEKIAEQIRKVVTEKIDIFLVLGSGWGDVATMIQNPITIPYSKLSGMPESTVAGHNGQFVFGYINGQYVCIMQGRFHMYEGYSPLEVCLPIDVMHELGVENIVLTNAAGGINPNFNSGDVVVIKDHINFTCRNPLIGIEHSDIYPIFLDMGKAYDKEFIEIIKKVGVENKIKLQEGTYMQVLGPNYETSAEVKAFSALGADMVAMSTVVEVIKARYYGMRVLGLSCITNSAAGGKAKKKLSHTEVLNVGINNKEKLKTILLGFLKKLSELQTKR